jgi:undecaprenyl-diphosphatase
MGWPAWRPVQTPQRATHGWPTAQQGRYPRSFLLRLDRGVFDTFATSNSRHWVAQSARRVSELGTPQVLLPILILSALLGNRTDRTIARDGIGAMVKATVATRLLKIAFGRVRPRDSGQGVFRGPSFRHDSFPSGHTALAFAVASSYANHRPNSSGLVYGLASLVGYSRVASRAHWPSDVWGGALVGIAVEAPHGPK